MCKRLLLLLFTFIVAVTYAQTKKISGKILGEDNKPLSGVTIQLKNAKIQCMIHCLRANFGSISIAIFNNWFNF